MLLIKHKNGTHIKKKIFQNYNVVLRNLHDGPHESMINYFQKVTNKIHLKNLIQF